jgi:tRNA-specific 2-thiouridylase
MQEAEKIGAEYIATGHYARVEPAHSTEQIAQSKNNSLTLLKKGIDPKKDQSYVLYILSQEQLKKLILPLGHYKKDEIKEIARGLKLPSAKRSESQEVCFVEDRNYFKFIEKLSPLAKKPGPIIDMTGKVIGTHKGIHVYTIGQRKGFGIAHKKPFYVVKIDALRNAVYVGTQENAKRREFLVEDLNWIIPNISPLLPPQAKGGEKGLSGFKASVKVRSMMKDEPATIYSSRITHHALPETVRLAFDEPQWAPASGQSAVFYNDDIVIGGGVIKIPS